MVAAAREREQMRETRQQAATQARTGESPFSSGKTACIKFPPDGPSANEVYGVGGGTSDGGDPDPQSGNNESTQARVLFFKDEGKAYQYMLDNSTKDIEQGGESTRPIENFAFVTKAGVYVLPTSGQDLDGNSYRNYAGDAEWRVLNYKIGSNGMSIEYKGSWKNVLATVHTHPFTSSMSVPSHSSADRGFTGMSRTLSVVLGFNNQAYGIIPGSSGAINFAGNSDLTSGRVSIIRHYGSLMQYFKSNK